MRAHAAILVVLIGCLSCDRNARTGRAVELPALEMTGFLPAVRSEIQAAYDAARSRPRDAATLGQLCMLLDAHEQFEAAASCYVSVRALAPAQFEWPYLLGVVREAQGQHAGAIDAFRAALRVREYDAARLKLAEALFADGRVEESERTYQAIVAADPAGAAAWYGLGRATEALGQPEKAIEYYTKACERFPAFGAAQYALGLAERKLGRAASAEHFRLAERNKTTVPPLNDTVRDTVLALRGGTAVHIRRAMAFEAAGQLPQAVQEHLAALELDPKFIQAHINLISLYGRIGETAKAEQHYRTARALAPGQADADYNFGVLLFNSERRDEAEPLFRSAIAANPQHAQAHHNLGFLLEERGAFSAALHEYEKAIAAQPDYPLAHFHAGRILANRRQYAPAITHFRRAAATDDPATPGYLYALAATYARAGQLDQAIATARIAREGAASRQQAELMASIDDDLRRMQARRNVR